MRYPPTRRVGGCSLRRLSAAAERSLAGIRNIWYEEEEEKGMELADLSRYFWDVDITTLDPARHRTYIIERLLEFGDEEATAWLLEQFSRSDILAVVNESRRLSPKSANYWKLMLAGTNASV